MTLIPILFAAAPAMAEKDSPDLDGVLARKSINVAMAVRPDAPRLRFWLEVFLSAKGIDLTGADMLTMIMKMADTP